MATVRPLRSARPHRSDPGRRLNAGTGIARPLTGAGEFPGRNHPGLCTAAGGSRISMQGARRYPIRRPMPIVSSAGAPTGDESRRPAAFLRDGSRPMSISSDERNPVELLAEEFLDRKRHGEQPTLRDYPRVPS